MASFSKRLAVINTFGTLGYLSLSIQWLWAVITVGYPLISSDLKFILPQNTAPEAPPPNLGIFSPIASIVAIIATIIVMIVTIIVIVRLPRTVGKQAASVTHRTAEVILPAVTHRKKLPKKQRVQLSYKIVVSLKILLTLLPIAGLFIASPTTGLTPSVVLAVGLFCAVLTCIYFGSQLGLASTLRVNREDVW